MAQKGALHKLSKCIPVDLDGGGVQPANGLEYFKIPVNTVLYGCHIAIRLSPELCLDVGLFLFLHFGEKDDGQNDAQAE